MEEEQEVHDKVAHTGTKRIGNDKNEITKKWTILILLMKSTVHKASN